MEAVKKCKAEVALELPPCTHCLKVQYSSGQRSSGKLQFIGFKARELWIKREFFRDAADGSWSRVLLRRTSPSAS